MEIYLHRVEIQTDDFYTIFIKTISATSTNLEHGGVEKFNLTDKEIANMCVS